MPEKNLSGKTKFSIDIVFDSNVPSKSVPVKTIQKGATPGHKGVAVTDPYWTCQLIQLHWDELFDPIAKKITMSIKELKIKVRFHCVTQYAKEVPKSSPCYKHIVKHEKLHVASRKSSLNKYKKLTIQYIKEATQKKFGKPLEVKESSAKKVRDDAYKTINTAVYEACEKLKSLSDKESKKVDSATENAKTQALCAQFV
ncbi:hypothetical protein [Ruegeria sp. HKCCD8929]|uniref:hypothetical protein n=1 Tax=Ruegeria sp. HKCCD8929 TaxID=2683006 RepID=UPI001489F297|nr:hypothetical protein [Ruegeria sp. HKCCD8929]